MTSAGLRSISLPPRRHGRDRRFRLLRLRAFVRRRCIVARRSLSTAVGGGGTSLPFDVLQDRSWIVADFSHHPGADFPQLRHDGIAFRVCHFTPPSVVHAVLRLQATCPCPSRSIVSTSTRSVSPSPVHGQETRQRAEHACSVMVSRVRPMPRVSESVCHTEARRPSSRMASPLLSAWCVKSSQ